MSDTLIPVSYPALEREILHSIDTTCDTVRPPGDCLPCALDDICATHTTVVRPYRLYRDGVCIHANEDDPVYLTSEQVAVFTRRGYTVTLVQ